MPEAAKPFAFSQLIPGFDFLKSLTGAAGGGSVPGLPGLSNWIAPTLSVEELDKRIRELKTVQYWLEQNVHALKATIQALEVQKMTLTTLRGMNVRMEDLANAFTRSATSMTDSVASAPTPPPEPAVKPFAAPPPAPVQEEGDDEEDLEEETHDDNDATEADKADDGLAEPQAESPPKSGKTPARGKSAAAAPGVIDPLQWWNSLTQQFQEIASNALQDAAQLRLPKRAPTAPPSKEKTTPKAATKKAAPKKKAAPARKSTSARKPAAKRPAARGRR